MKNTPKRLANFVKQKRLEQGLHQNEVANYLGYSSSQFISNWERGIATPPTKILKKLCKLYKIDLKEIFELLLDLEEVELRKSLGLSGNETPRNKF